MFLGSPTHKKEKRKKKSFGKQKKKEERKSKQALRVGDEEEWKRTSESTVTAAWRARGWREAAR
eukprot:3095349-Rhodomonas_salina.3